MVGLRGEKAKRGQRIVCDCGFIQPPSPAIDETNGSSCWTTTETC